MSHARPAQDEAPSSQVRISGALPTMSERLWRLSWADELPATMDGIAVELGSFATAYAFVEEHWEGIFSDGAERFYVEELTEAKRRFWDEMDIFVFRAEDGRVAGMAGGHPTDWSTYYFRTFALLPEYRERRFASVFATHVIRVLRTAGVVRLEAECSVANVAMTRLFVGHGFLMTSTLNTERWGTMLRFTKFVDEKAEGVFRRQFVNVPAYGKRDESSERRKP